MKRLNTYLCGPTVYNSPHIGNMRPIVFFDILLRAHSALGVIINFVHNITDIDDKIIEKAIHENQSEKNISEKYFLEYINLLKEFNIQTPTHLEKVTDNLEVIDSYIQKVQANNFTYKSNEDILFNIANLKKYGEVSNQKLDMLISQETININKKQSQDFVLWKKTSKGIKFDSSFGKGRPGWHTECAALIDKHFGAKGVDIHGGGIDLKFPHHENENAQHLAIYNKSITKKWMWTGLININEQKMSKSLNNFLLAKDFLKQYPADLFRLIILNSSFNSVINLNDELISNNLKLLNRFKTLHNNFQAENPKWKFQMIEDKEILEIMELVANVKFAQANLKIMSLFNEALKNDKAKIKIFTLWKKLGFLFMNSEIPLHIHEIYKNWKKSRNLKNFLKADQFREILKKNLIIF
ncbi:cysteine--tRNA ligase [Mycoplasma iguanae]|uniref:Cysteine--tRNA ligase n=1 Tax=Mycoplasma iguanae TaxID=292461 RepID=A0ABY5R7N0_9MOLU|nr:cysteine--tRNA ligase [Mycoplasma iguanae]UVD81464.1 cysteine--tRNA ligase [Mycoplasma iguanae]